eukprot:2537159-Pleurochrysis_carterae.AAC.2
MPLPRAGSPPNQEQGKDAALPLAYYAVMRGHARLLHPRTPGMCMFAWCSARFLVPSSPRQSEMRLRPRLGYAGGTCQR